MVDPNSHARKGGGGRGEGECGRISGEEDGIRRLRRNGATQSATCYTMCEKRLSGDWAREVSEKWQRSGPTSRCLLPRL